MSMLNRFRKQGGFQQLLTLIETCDPIKQESLLHLVSSEDPGWAHLVKTKCLTRSRIFSWPESILQEIVPQLPEMVAVALFFSLDKPGQEKLRGAMTKSAVRSFDELLSRSNPTSSEQNAARIKLFQVVRTLELDGKLKFQTFDPALVIDPSIAA